MTDVATTHAEGCWAWGPKHHACAVREIERLRARVADAEAVRHSLNEMVRVLDGSVNEVDADFDVEAIERVLGTAAWNDQLTVVKADTVRCWMAKIEGLRRTIKAQVGELSAARDAQSKAEEDVESLRARVAELEEGRQDMHLRDRLAAKAIQGLLANPSGPIQANGMSGWGLCNCTIEQVADFAWHIADHMLKARGGSDASAELRTLRARVAELERDARLGEEREQSDEALLRQALEALERGAWDTLSGRNAAFAIRERLGLGE